MSSAAIFAGWLISGSSSPARNRWLVATDGVIDYIGSDLPTRFQSIPRFDGSELVIMPGLINSHCHLEFSDLAAPIPYHGSFTQWIRDVVQHRRSTAEVSLERTRSNSLSAGLRNAFETGTRVILDTVTTPWKISWVEQALRELAEVDAPLEALVGKVPLTYIPCPEVLDINRMRRHETLQFYQEVNVALLQPARSPLRNVKDLLERDCDSTSTFPIAVSPHAPYTASVGLVKEIVSAMGSSRRPEIASMHLAESIEEIEWLKTRAEPLESALRTFRDEAFLSAHQSHSSRSTDSLSGSDRSFVQIADYLDAMLQFPVAVIAHGNHLERIELERLASESGRAAIVHCPRTFRHFHPSIDESYPMNERLELGVTHLLGTDSMASSPDLNLWHDAQILYREHSIAGGAIVAMLTAIPAKLLGLTALGTLEVGKCAHCTAVSIPQEAAANDLSHKDLWGHIFDRNTQARPLEHVLGGKKQQASDRKL